MCPKYLGINLFTLLKMFLNILIHYVYFKFSWYVYQCFKYKNVRYTKLCNSFKYFGTSLENCTVSEDHVFNSLKLQVQWLM